VTGLLAGFSWNDTGFFTEPDKFGNGVDLQFLHDAAPVDLDCLQRNIQKSRMILPATVNNTLAKA
jgi:hypothetical protein